MPDDFDPYADSATAVANAPGSLAADPFAFDDTAEQRRRRALQRQAKTTAFSQGQSLGQRLAPQRSEVDDLGDLLANHALPRQMKQSKTRKTLLEADLQARKAMLDEFDQQNTDLLPDLIKGKTGTAREAARAKADLAAKAAGLGEPWTPDPTGTSVKSLETPGYLRDPPVVVHPAYPETQPVDAPPLDPERYPTVAKVMT